MKTLNKIVIARDSTVVSNVEAVAVSEAVAESDTAAYLEAVASNEEAVEELKRKLKEEGELRRLAEHNVANLTQKMNKLVMFHEVDEEKIRQLNREKESKSRQCEKLEAKLVELHNKIGPLEDEVKLLREENSKLRDKEAERLELVNQVTKLLKKF